MVSHTRLGGKEGGEAVSCFHMLDESLLRMIGKFVRHYDSDKISKSWNFLDQGDEHLDED